MQISLTDEAIWRVVREVTLTQSGPWQTDGRTICASKYRTCAQHSIACRGEKFRSGSFYICTAVRPTRDDD